jgi:hypothetical protein
MISFDVTQVKIEHLITHYVGNKLRDEDIKFSNEETAIENDSLDYLLKYFLQSFGLDEQFKFVHTIDLELNEVYKVTNQIFNNPEIFLENSKNIAKLLYEYSMHPKVKGGELNVALFSGVLLDGKATNAIGIFKSEHHSPFLRMDGMGSRFKIHHELGLELKSMDKGCLILDVKIQDGCTIFLASGINKSVEAQYWKDDFLKVKPIGDDYNYTKELLTLTKNFVTKQFLDDFEVTKTDQIDILNRSMDYFKTNDNFVRDDFENTVFQDKNVISSFRKFDEIYREEKEIELSDNFSISSQAVKKQSRIFKSVLKLDKNFDIYIHGDKELIEKGVEKDGRKYYKIYYDEEK